VICVKFNDGDKFSLSKNVKVSVVKPMPSLPDVDEITPNTNIERILVNEWVLAFENLTDEDRSVMRGALQ
jgi:hypothetical protein